MIFDFCSDEQKTDIFLKPLQDQRVKEGRDKKARFEGVFCKSNCKAKWFKNKQELFMGKKFKMTSTGDLHVLEINDPKLDDDGKYVCQCLEVKSEALLTVDAPDPVYKFTKKLMKDMNSYTGRETILECQTNSAKAPIKWYKGEDRLETGQKYFIEEDGQKKYLRIQNSDPEDSGNYSCRIINTEEITTCAVTITDQMFKFMRVLRSIRVNETNEICLECEIDESYAPVTWYKDGVELKPGDKIVKLEVDGRKRRLVIKKSKVDDEGKYLCKTRGDETDSEVLVERKYYKQTNYALVNCRLYLNRYSCQSIQEKVNRSNSVGKRNGNVRG